MVKKFIPIIVTMMFLCFWYTNAEAARAFGIAQTPVIGSQFDMRSTQTITFTITNSNTAGTTDRIYMMRFRLNTGCGTLPCAASVFSNATAAPPNWTRTAWSTTSVTFRANSWAYAIPSTGTNTFPIVFTMGNMTVDTTVTLRDVRASFTTTGTFCYSGCAPLQNATASGTVTLPAGAGGSCSVMTNGSTPAINTCVSWQLMSLSLSFLITDLGGTPVTSIPAGSGFISKMTVTNNSSVAQNGIVSSPSPPTATIAPPLGVTLNNPAPVFNPNPLNLAAGAAGTITYTYTTAAADAGTVYFTAFATRGGVATSSSKNSISVGVGQFVASITVNPTCAYNGQNITVTMKLTNKYPNNIVIVTPILTPSVGAPVSWVAGPNPPAPNGPVPPNGGTFNFQWTYQIGAGTPGQTFNFSSSATGTEQTIPYPPGTARFIVSSPSGTVTRGGYTVSLNPVTTSANSAYEELIWSFQNQGCKRKGKRQQ